jgi:chitinase
LIDPTTFAVVPSGVNDTDLYKRTVALKKRNPALQVFISVGGATQNPTVFSSMVASNSSTITFISSLVALMNHYGFDGVDIDWEYPGSLGNGGNAADVANYVTFLHKLRSALGTRGISITIPGSFYFMQSFDVVDIEPYVDWFNFMAYDYHGIWDAPSVPPHAIP